MNQRESIHQLVEQETLDAKLRAELRRVQKIRRFASERLGLPNNDSYTDYVALDRDYVTWVVFAAPELSLQPINWCFWVVGCVPYRGYFTPDKAQRFADMQAKSNLEVYVAPVAAYSTLGWFSDPVLSTMLSRGTVTTAEYIFHELAHQQVYFKNDSDFNEAFASAVAELGVEEWLSSQNRYKQLMKYKNDLHEKRQIYSLINDLRMRLQNVYGATTSKEQKRMQKQQILQSYRDQMEHMLKNWPQGQRYHRWALEDVNNAKLNAIATYQNLVPDFLKFFAACDRDYISFYQAIAQMQSLNKLQRRENLRQARCMLIAGGQN